MTYVKRPKRKGSMDTLKFYDTRGSLQENSIFIAKGGRIGGTKIKKICRWYI